MNENSSQTVKEISNDKEIQNTSEIKDSKDSQIKENLSFDEKNIPSADSSSSRKNDDLEKAGFT